MIRMCYGKNHVGDRKMGEKEPFENNEETHGLCDPCFEFEKIEIQLALKRLRDAGWPAYAKASAGKPPSVEASAGKNHLKARPPARKGLWPGGRNEANGKPESS